MRHAIDPKIDCVFKAILGSEENRNLLIHFLNAILGAEISAPIKSVEILNPFNDKEFLNDKLSIVDIKAADDRQHIYQIEIQLCSNKYLPTRILYNWTDLYSQQLKSGQTYQELKPTYSIWLLAENLLPNDGDYIHHYKMRDEQGHALSEQGGIWLLELNKFNGYPIDKEDRRWLKFFKEGEQLNDEALPDWMNTLEMRQAMSTLSRFSEKDRQYFEYQARQEYLRVQQANEREKQEIEQEKLVIEREKQVVEQEKQIIEQEKQVVEQEKQIIEQEKQVIEQEKQVIAHENQLIKQKLDLTTSELIQAKQSEEAAKQSEESARLREKAALAEVENLKALLAKKEP
jgi:predicted transposase/invertase (TIGR01784 family)